MLILPAIDLIKGECVRLTQGDFSQSKTYFKDPLKVAQNFIKAGAKFLHVVDLEGAKMGKPINLKTIQKFKGFSIQVGGGIRTLEDAKNLLEQVDRVILGTAAISNLEMIKTLIDQYGPERIIIGVDAKDEKVLVEGWLIESKKTLPELLEELKQIGVSTIIFTDIKRDGMLKGPNFESIKKVIATGLNVIVAGGITTLKDLEELKNIGAYGAIIGKALYEGTVNLSQAIEEFQKNNLAKRIIPCMDIKDGRVVKGTNFEGLKDAGDSVILAKSYSENGADELVFLDITATIEGRKTFCQLVERIAANINIPFTVGGGISSTEDIRTLLNSGADKISIGSAAVRNPKLVRAVAEMFGSQCVVISVDAKKTGANWNIYIDGGRTDTGLNAIEFALQMEKLGAGELLVNSLDRDGTAQGYDLELLAKITAKVKIPVIASSGAGKKEDFLAAFKEANVDAVLGASVFHYGQIEIPELKQFLRKNNITIRS